MFEHLLTPVTYHASCIVHLLGNNQMPGKKVMMPSKVNLDPLSMESIKREKVLSKLIKAQLSHSDGMRGFFARYLTGEGYMVADKEHVPAPLQEAMKQANLEHLAPLACKCVCGCLDFGHNHMRVVGNLMDKPSP